VKAVELKQNNDRSMLMEEVEPETKGTEVERGAGGEK